MGENETADISTASSSTPPAAPKMRTPLNRNSSVRSVRRLSLGDEISIISDGGRGSVLDDEAREVRGLARKETFKVNLLRVMVAICILSAASIISIYTYRILRDEEKEDSQASVRLPNLKIVYKMGHNPLINVSMHFSDPIFCHKYSLNLFRLR